MRLGKRNDQAPPEYEAPPEDFYVLKFVEYDQPVQSAYKDRNGEYPMRIRLVFEIDDPDVEEKYQGEQCSMWCNLEVNALVDKSIYHPLYALDPDNEPEGGEDLEEYFGKKCRGELKHVVKGDKTYANVASVKAIRRRRRQAEPEPEAEPEKPKRSAFDIDDEAA